jgi:hypothetical protein
VENWETKEQFVLKMEEDETINFIPHPNTLTTTGDQNYRDNDRGKKAFPFAIAEKIVSVT